MNYCKHIFMMQLLLSGWLLDAKQLFVLPYAYQFGQAYFLFRTNKAKVYFFGGLPYDKKSKKTDFNHKLAKLFSKQTKALWGKSDLHNEHMLHAHPSEEHFRHSVATTKVWLQLAEERAKTVEKDQLKLLCIEVPFIKQQVLSKAPAYYAADQDEELEDEYVWIKAVDICVKKNQEWDFKPAKSVFSKTSVYDSSVETLLKRLTHYSGDIVSQIIHPSKEVLDRFSTATQGKSTFYRLRRQAKTVGQALRSRRRSLFSKKG
ncbi:hypothetical protein IPH25_04635 [bacterium]|nr:MAG: hypothetical protein IPG37_01630 [bacterium]QQR61728.1 MAG: hypothetical protein IPH25_04635 [bacterium]QQR62704.1 MAG: hypothetical protein IPH67_04800 [bacterium]